MFGKKRQVGVTIIRMSHERFLQEKYPDLPKSEEVESAAKRTQARTGKEFPLQSAEDASTRVQNYLDRFNEILDREDPEKRERGVEAIKRVLHNEFVIKPEEIPESYFESIKRRHRQEGHGDIEIPDDYRYELSGTIIGDQIKSLDNWIDYFASDDAKYPNWLKYYATRSVLRMGRYDKQKKSFTERTGGAIAPFPDLNREALAIVLDSFERQSRGEAPKFGYDIQDDAKGKFLQFLEKKNFPKLYALAIEEFKPIAEELLKTTQGKWIKYPRGSDHMPLVQSISDYGTGWCLRGEAMAQRYLVRDKNDLHVYYSLDQAGKPTVPRVVMVVNANNQLAEVRGVAPEENLDPYIGGVVQEKLKEFPDGAAYEKKTQDMKLLTAVENKVKKGQDLDKDDLVFLYEIKSQIEGFGYQNDPRVAELRQTRNPKEDMLIIFECAKEQIAHNLNEINSETKAYVGPLTSGIFDTTQQYNIEHVYTAFPEGNIPRETVIIGGRTKEQLASEFKQKNIKIASFAQSVFDGKDFTTLENPEEVNLIRLTVAALGFESGATTDEIYKRAEELGLDLCPAEAVLHLRLKYTDQPMGDVVCIGTKQIASSDGVRPIFKLESRANGLSLGSPWAGPTSYWDPDTVFVFRLRKKT